MEHFKFNIENELTILEKYEVEYINSVAEEVDVVLVITKSYRKNHSARLIKGNFC